MGVQVVAWVGFLVLIGLFLALDLGVFHKGTETPSTKSALKWTLVWFIVALCFDGAIYFLYEHKLLGLGANASGSQASVLFLTGYLVEQSLSLDNIFVMALIFRFFKIPGDLQHRILFWGILGAIFLRITMILLGAALVTSFEWSILIFGFILVYTAVKMAMSKGDDDFDPEDSFIVKFARRHFPFSAKMDGTKFFTDVDGKRVATPLFLVLIVIEGSDVVFAVDSIPAVFGVTTDPFIVFTSNIFAILGLRSLYFALASLLRRFALLKYSLMLVLLFVGVKMIVSHWWHPDWMSYASLGFIVMSLVGGVLASLFLKPEEADEEDPKSSLGSSAMIQKMLPKDQAETEGGPPRQSAPAKDEQEDGG